MSDTAVNSLLEQDLPAQSLSTLSAPCSRRILGFRRGYMEIISRIARIILSFMLFLFLIIVLASNNSSSTKSLPKVNCSVKIDKIDVDFIRGATNTFGGIYIAVTILAMFFEGAMFTLRVLNVNVLEEKWKIFYSVNSFVTQIFIHLFAGGIVGIFLITRFWGPYIDAVHSNGVSLASANLVYKMSLALCSFFIATYIYYFISYSKVVSYGARTYGGRTGCGKCDNCKKALPQL